MIVPDDPLNNRILTDAYQSQLTPSYISSQEFKNLCSVAVGHFEMKSEAQREVVEEKQILRRIGQQGRHLSLQKMEGLSERVLRPRKKTVGCSCCDLAPRHVWRSDRSSKKHP